LICIIFICFIYAEKSTKIVCRLAASELLQRCPDSVAGLSRRGETAGRKGRGGKGRRGKGEGENKRGRWGWEGLAPEM